VARERITHAEYLQIVGLYKVADDLLEQVRAFAESINSIVGGDRDDLDNHVNDILWGASPPTADALLASMKIEVDPAPRQQVTHFSTDATNAKCGDQMTGEHHYVSDKPQKVNCPRCESWLDGYEAAKENSVSANS
jgi:hypothetical protein